MTKSKRTDMRRKDRQINDDSWIRDFLGRAPFMTVAFADGAQPYVYPITFVYSKPDNAIFFHGTPSGNLRQLVDKNPNVSLTIAEMGRLLPSEIAMGFSVEFESVVAFGKCRVIENFEEGTRALHLMIDKYFPHLKRDKDYRATTPGEFKATSVYKVEIKEWSGKKKKEKDNYEGAFPYPYHKK